MQLMPNTGQLLHNEAELPPRTKKSFLIDILAERFASYKGDKERKLVTILTSNMKCDWARLALEKADGIGQDDVVEVDNKGCMFYHVLSCNLTIRIIRPSVFPKWYEDNNAMVIVSERHKLGVPLEAVRAATAKQGRSRRAVCIYTQLR